MRIPWQNNGPRILLSLFSFLVHRSPPSTDHGRHPRWKEARSSGRNGVLASQNTLGPSKLPTFEPAYVHSDVPRVLVARRSVDYIGTCAVASQPAARQNYTNRGVALSTAWYLVAYGTVRIARYYPPCLRVLAGPSRFFADQVCLFFVPCFLNSWNWWLFVRGLCRV